MMDLSTFSRSARSEPATTLQGQLSRSRGGQGARGSRSTPRMLVLPLSAAPAAAVQLIIDTDMAGDVDDVGALCLAHALADRGEAAILAVLHNALVPEGIVAVQVLNRYYGRGGIPVGVYRNPEYCCPDLRGQGPRPYVPEIVAEFGAEVELRGDSVDDGFSTYRRALAGAADGSVVIALIGFASNLLALLQSGPDEHSALDGRALVEQKVQRLIWMGGRFEDSRSHGSPEFNFAGREGSLSGLAAITSQALHLWPSSRPIAWLGAEVGWDVCHGARLVELPESNPCRRAYAVWGGEWGNCCNCGKPGGPIERQSWDPMAILFAARARDGGSGELSYLNLSAHESGHMDFLLPSGHNHWGPEAPPGGNGTQAYLYFRGEGGGAAYGAAIDELLAAPRPPPQNSRPRRPTPPTPPMPPTPPVPRPSPPPWGWPPDPPPPPPPHRRHRRAPPASVPTRSAPAPLRDHDALQLGFPHLDGLSLPGSLGGAGSALLLVACSCGALCACGLLGKRRRDAARGKSARGGGTRARRIPTEPEDADALIREDHAREVAAAATSQREGGRGSKCAGGEARDARLLLVRTAPTTRL